MSSSLYDCSFTPEGGSGQRINPLDPLKRDGSDLDIRALVHDIVTRDFEYQGMQKYTLTLTNTAAFRGMTLEIWDGDVGVISKVKGKIDFGTGQLLPPYGAAQKVADLTQAGLRLDHTLLRISQAYTGAAPGATPLLAAASGGAQVHGAGPIVSPDTSALEAAIKSMEQELGRLRKALEQQRMDQGQQIADAVRQQTRDLEGKARQLERQIQELREQNQALLGIQRTLEKIDSEIPENLGEIAVQLKEISEAIRQLKSPGRSDDTVRLILGRIDSALQRLAEPAAAVRQEVEELKKEKARLSEDNAALRETLSLRDRTISDLTHANQKQAEKLRKAKEEVASQRLSMQLQNLINADLDTELKASQQREAELLQEIRGLKDQLKAFDALKLKCDLLKQVLASANAVINKQAETIARLQREAESTKAADALGQKALEDLRAQLAKRELAYERDIQPLRGAQLNIRQLEETLASLDKTYTALLDYQKEREKDHKRLRQQHARLVDEHGVLRKQVEEALGLLGTVDAEADRLREANGQLSAKVQELDMENLRKLRLNEMYVRDMARLKEDNRRLREEIQALRDQLELARKTGAASEKTIQQLQADLRAKDQQIIREREAAEKADQLSRRLQRSLDDMTSSRDVARRALEQLQLDYKALEAQYDELSATSSEIEAEQDKKIKQLEETLARALEQLKQAERQHASKTEMLAQQQEAARKKAISDGLLQKQLDVLTRRYNEAMDQSKIDAETIRNLRQMIEKLQEQLEVWQRHTCPTLPPLRGDVRDAPSVPPMPTTPVNPTGNIVADLKKMGTEIPSAWVANILINLDYLGMLPQEEKALDAWIKAHFDNLSDVDILDKKKHLKAHKLPSTPTTPYTETNMNRIVGDISTVLSKAERFQQAEGRYRTPFLETVSRGKDLLTLRTQLEPLVKQYKKLKPKEIPSSEQRQYDSWDKTVARADELLRQIDEVSTLMKEKLAPKEKFKVKA